jgi:hypothetical protein
VLYIASPLSSATNGASIRAEGGILQTIWLKSSLKSGLKKKIKKK